MPWRNLVVAGLMIGVSTQAALALSTDDDMAAWAAAPVAERSALVDEIMSNARVPGHVSRSELLDCLNLASSVSGHQSLPISEVAEACLHPSVPGDQAQMGPAVGLTALWDEGPATTNAGRP